MSLLFLDCVQGTRVTTPQGQGSVAYVRMAPPTYAQVDVVSVVLDSRRADPRYRGTIFNASEVHNA